MYIYIYIYIEAAGPRPPHNCYECQAAARAINFKYMITVVNMYRYTH